MPASFFSKSSAANVWKTVIGVSAAGSKRGRGKGMGRAVVKDFNRGQEIGVGRRKIILAGLNAPVTQANRVTQINDVGPDESFQKNIQEVRKTLDKFRKFRENPIDRGWSGRKAHGRAAGQPDDLNETPFDGFHSTVLMLRPLLSMSGVLGRTRRMHALVVTGNGDGLAGFSTAIGTEGRSVVRHARNMASQQLVRIERWQNHTVMHDFFSRYYDTTVFVQRKPRGYGIKAHRIVKAICQAFGITDLYAKVEGSTANQINLTKAFFLGLMNQKRYEDMAEEKQLHLVEMMPQNFYFPTVLASPKSRVRDDEEIKARDENLDFTYYIYDGRIKMVKAKPRNPFESHPMWYKHLDREDYGKNREKTKLFLAAKYGDKQVKDVFPLFKATAGSFYKEE